MFDIIPQDIILNNTKEVRCAVSEDTERIAIYAPYQVDITVGADLSGYNLTLINLKNRLFAKPVISVNSDRTVIKLSGFNSDVLILGIKRV